MARQYRAEVNELTDGSVSVTLRVDIQRGTKSPAGDGKTDNYRLGRCYLQRRVWVELIGPLLVAGGFVIDLKSAGANGS